MRPVKKTALILVSLVLFSFSTFLAPAFADIIYANDVSKHWSKDYVYYLQRNGLIKGYPDGTFRPDQLVTRAEFTHMLINVYNNPYTKTNRLQVQQDPSASVEKFSDAASIPDWAKNSIEAAIKYGFINGTPDGSFNPENNISRAEAITIIGRTLAGEYDLSQLDCYADEIPEWAQAEAAKARAKGFLEVTKEGLFKPDELITRGELAKLILIYYCAKDLYK
jgi:hypothetical protein